MSFFSAAHGGNSAGLFVKPYVCLAIIIRFYLYLQTHLRDDKMPWDVRRNTPKKQETAGSVQMKFIA